LVEKFGKSSPATGFSMGINMVMMALDRQKVEFEKPRLILLSAIGRRKENSFSNM